MVTINRFQKATIKACDWHINVVELENGTFLYDASMQTREDGEIIKEERREMTKEEAEKYIKKHRNFLVETYKKDSYE